jgi:hypothetical protein
MGAGRRGPSRRFARSNQQATEPLAPTNPADASPRRVPIHQPILDSLYKSRTAEVTQTPRACRHASLHGESDSECSCVGARSPVMFHDSADVCQMCRGYKLDPVIDPATLQMALGVLTGWRDRREREAIAYMIEENRLLRRQRGTRRLRLTDDDRRRLAARAYRLGRAAYGRSPRSRRRTPCCGGIAG